MKTVLHFIIAMLCLLCSGLMTADVVLAGNQKTVALVMKDLFNPFFVNMESGAKAYAKKHNIPFEVFGVERETEVEHQIFGAELLLADAGNDNCLICKISFGKRRT